MNASRRRTTAGGHSGNFHPSSPMDMFMSSSRTGVDSIRDKLDREKEQERLIQGTCSHCGKFGGDALKSCSRCKAARYCDQSCQLADFKARHKRECSNFTHPPTTRAFLTKPLPNDRFPPRPVFAHWHEDGVGCWISIDGRIDCDLGSLTDSVSPRKGSYSDRQMHIASGPDSGRSIIRTHKAAARSLLSLAVLVQNRRKDKAPIVVFGSRAQVVGYPSVTSSILRGSAQNDNLAKFTHDRVSYVAAGVANDPWDKVPRLEVMHLNGVDISDKKPPLPASIKNADEGVVALKQGEYVIYNLQFRIGDGDSIAKDFQALACLEAIHIPYATWDGTTSPSTLAASLPLVHSQPESGDASTSADSGKSLRAPFTQSAVRAHYADFIEHGEEAYVRAHFGDARADMVRSSESMMEMMGEMLLGSVAQSGNTGVLVQRLRDMGMQELADKIATRD